MAFSALLQGMVRLCTATMLSRVIFHHFSSLPSLVFLCEKKSGRLFFHHFLSYPVDAKAALEVLLGKYHRDPSKISAEFFVAVIDFCLDGSELAQQG